MRADLASPVPTEANRRSADPNMIDSKNLVLLDFWKEAPSRNLNTVETVGLPGYIFRRLRPTRQQNRYRYPSILVGFLRCILEHCDEDLPSLGFMAKYHLGISGSTWLRLGRRSPRLVCEVTQDSAREDRHSLGRFAEIPSGGCGSPTEEIKGVLYVHQMPSGCNTGWISLFIVLPSGSFHRTIQAY